jgi:hypothetical protein
MSVKVITSCDGPRCDRQIDSTIHANTWLELNLTQLSSRGESQRATKNFCGYVCLLRYTIKTLDNLIEWNFD